MKAMILLALNAGFGNSDCANLPRAAVDLDRGWVHFPRPKTGLIAAALCGPETVEAICRVAAKRRDPKDAADADLLFITKIRLSVAKDTTTNPVSQEMASCFARWG